MHIWSAHRVVVYHFFLAALRKWTCIVVAVMFVNCDLWQRGWDESHYRIKHLSDCGSPCVEYQISFNSLLMYNLVIEPDDVEGRHLLLELLIQLAHLLERQKMEQQVDWKSEDHSRLQLAYLFSEQRRRICPLCNSAYFFLRIL